MMATQELMDLKLTKLKKMSKLDNNKLIAEFMRFPTQIDAVDDRTIAYYIRYVINADNTNNLNEDHVFHPDDMKFHEEWNWLMPVVNNCKSYSLDNTYADRIDEALVESEIDFDYLFCAVLDFIEWYNNENK